VVICRDSVISVEDLPFREDMGVAGEGHKDGEGMLRGSMEELERKLILDAMEKTGIIRTKAADLLGISERMLRYKLKKYNLKG